MSEPQYWVLAYYIYTNISDPHREVEKHKQFLQDRDAVSRIYISEEGINGQMSAEKEDAKAYIEWMQSDPRLQKMSLKVHLHHENVFPRLTIKYREQLVAFDRKVDLSNSGTHVKPEDWKKMLESDEEYHLIDVRNDYETKIGHFKGADLPLCGAYREFPEYVKDLKKKKDPSKTKVMMCCTGGIRCETFSSYMKEEGFTEVYQLEGGLINYGLKVGKAHWEGHLFVFDDRLVVPLDGNMNDTHSEKDLAPCYFCGTHTHHYHNCANMDCNKLFLSCHTCYTDKKGACNHSCEVSPRIRPIIESDLTKPFRKRHLIQTHNI